MRSSYKFRIRCISADIKLAFTVVKAVVLNPKNKRSIKQYNFISESLFNHKDSYQALQLVSFSRN